MVEWLMLERLLVTIEKSFGIPPEVQYKIISSVVIGLGVWLVWQLANWTLISRIQDVRLAYRVRKTIAYLMTLAGFLLIGRVWFKGVQSLATFLGLFSAGLAIALREPVVNLAGWAFILWRHPFRVGDRVAISGFTGDVVDIRVFSFSLMEIGNWVQADQSTGRLIHMPNGKVFNEPIANYTAAFNFIWDEVPVLLSLESDWRKAKQLMQGALARHTEKITHEREGEIRHATRHLMLSQTQLTPVVYTSVTEQGVILTMRYLVSPQRRRAVRELLWEELLDRFSEQPDITFGNPTQRIYASLTEPLHSDKAPKPWPQ